MAIFKYDRAGLGLEMGLLSRIQAATGLGNVGNTETVKQQQNPAKNPPAGITEGPASQDLVRKTEAAKLNIKDNLGNIVKEIGNNLNVEGAYIVGGMSALYAIYVSEIQQYVDQMSQYFS